MILVIEPQCGGFEHSHFNAAMLASLAEADEDLIFCAERSHIEIVRSILQTTAFGTAIRFTEVDIAPRKLEGTSRLAFEIRTLSMALKKTGTRPSRLLLSSTTTQSVYAAALIQPIFLHGSEIAFIVHSILETAFVRPSFRPWKMPYWFRLALAFSRKRQMRFIVLGESIRRNVSQHAKHIRLESARLPCLFPAAPPPPKLKGERPSFGFIGTAEANKGFIDFIELATVHMGKGNRFILAGFARQAATRKIASEMGVEGIQESPLSEEEFRIRIAEMDYACFLYKPETYKYVASGAFFDAVSAEIPIIAIRNDYLEWYFDHFGNIGYLCAGMQEIHEIVSRLSSTGIPKEYEIQQGNLRRIKKDHSLASIGKEFIDCLTAPGRDQR